MKTQFKSNMKSKDRKSVNTNYHNKNKSTIIENSIEALFVKNHDR